MKPTLAEIQTNLLPIVAEIARAHNQDGEQIELATRLRADLDFTSLDIIHLLASIDMRFRCKLKYDLLLRRGTQFADDLSVGELADFVFQHFDDQITEPVAM